MFIDASALTAILVDEPDGPALLARIDRAEVRQTSPLALWETAIAVARVLAIDEMAAADAVERFCDLAGITIGAVPPDAARIAIGAWARFGKGRHPAALNFGDCFAYACARLGGQPLLFKGDDFGRTDIAVA